jgi:hypothetical protein
MTTPTRKFDRLMAVPMFIVSLLFLVFVAATVQEFRALSTHPAPERMRFFMLGALSLFPVFWAEAAWHYRQGSPLRRKALIPCLFPPLRLAARDRQTGTAMWLPLLGWRQIDDDLGRIARQQEFVEALAAELADEALTRPASVARLVDTVSRSLKVHTGTGPIDLARIGVGVSRASSQDRLVTHMVPTRFIDPDNPDLLALRHRPANRLFHAFATGSVQLAGTEEP